MLPPTPRKCYFCDVGGGEGWCRVLILPSLARVDLPVGAEGENTLAKEDDFILGSLEFRVVSSFEILPLPRGGGEG